MDEKIVHKSLDEALLAIQMEIENPQKNALNPHFKNRYADYNAVNAAVTPVYNRHGVLIKQRTVLIDGKNYLKITLVHPASGQKDEENLTEIIFNAGNPQSQGSGISYARRYGLQTVSGTGADDDDGEKAKKTPPPLPPPADTKQQNTEAKQRTPIESKLAACKTIGALDKAWKELNSEEQTANKEFASKVKEHIKSKSVKKETENQTQQ